MGDVVICRQSCEANVNKVKSTKSSMPVYIFSKSRVGRIGVFAGRFWAPGLKFVTLAVEQYTCGISILTLTLACTAGRDSLLMENFEAEKKPQKREGRGFLCPVLDTVGSLETAPPHRSTSCRQTPVLTAVTPQCIQQQTAVSSHRASLRSPGRWKGHL